MSEARRETTEPTDAGDPGAPGSQISGSGPGQIVGLSLLAAAVGLLAGLGAAAFVKAEHSLQHLLWTDLPEALGHEAAPPWLVLALLVTGALIVFVALRLPGHGGHHPLQGLALDIGPREIASVVLAALGSLSFGAVLGPEAPLMAVGSACGALALRDPTRPARTVMMIAGAMAAVGAIFGNPLITAVLLLEVALLAGPRVARPVVLIPALAALASGYALQVGVAEWSGLGQSQLSIPGLPAYPTVRFVDLAVALPLSAVVAALCLASRWAALRVEASARRHQLGTLLGAAGLIALSAVVVDEVTGGGLDLVLFSGQNAMGQYFALTSVGTVAVVLLGKFVAYAASLGSGFRGGAVFPAVALGGLLATMAALLVESASISALSAAAIAAAVVAVVRLPFLGTMLAVLLTMSAGGATTVPAIMGAIVGFWFRTLADPWPGQSAAAEDAPVTHATPPTA